MERRLAAILCADAAGDSRLTGDEGEDVSRAIESYRDAIDEAVGAHGGRVIDTADDVVLAEFAGSAAALDCALAAQRQLAAHDHGPSADHASQVRIGVDFGEILANDVEVSRAGIDVAERLKTLAAPGGICVSIRVLEQVEDRSDVGFAYLGEHIDGNKAALKAFSVLLDPADAGTVTGVRGRGPVWPWLAIGLGIWVVAAGTAFLWWRTW